MLAHRVDAGKAPRVRARLLDGRMIEGIANTASPDHVSILHGPTQQLTPIPAQQVVSLEIARQYPIAIGASVGAAAVFISVPLALRALGVPDILAYLGMVPAILVLVPLLRRLVTRLRRWETLYPDGAA